MIKLRKDGNFLAFHFYKETGNTFGVVGSFYQFEHELYATVRVPVDFCKYTSYGAIVQYKGCLIEVEIKRDDSIVLIKSQKDIKYTRAYSRDSFLDLIPGHTLLFDEIVSHPYK